MASYRILKNERFGRLVVQTLLGKDNNGHYKWKCKCDCGNKAEVTTGNLVNGHTNSCGCLRREVTSQRRKKHGESKYGGGYSREYRVWENMKKRCCDPNSPAYNNYGGRGIKICTRWLDKERGYQNFLEDMGRCPKGLTLERKDNDGDYCSENCIWATRKVQNNNKRNNIILEYLGTSKTLSGWSEEVGIKHELLYLRIRRGWSVEKALTQPVKK